MSEMSLDDRRREVLDLMLAEAAFEGWTESALEIAARDTGLGEDEITRGDLKILFPKGISDVLDFWAEEADRAMTEAYEGLEEPPAKIREKISWLVRHRIELLEPHREAARRAAATLALPIHAALAARLSWRTAGAMWQALGDTSTDGNWYTKRATLSAVYLSTLARWFADDSEMDEQPFAATWAFLDDRISNVMQIEKWKAGARKLPLDPSGLASFFGRLRYGGGQ